ncbi:MAG TPA: hypothetical protein VNN22_04970 [Verrucomicrobiae bacterium]|nr:hypothetical protein [Verrucomicrobiae bacterium]
MAHELIPKEGQPPLPIDEIIRRLKGSFKHVKLDIERASKDCKESIQRMTSALKRGAKWCSAEDVDREKRVLGHSVYVIVADDPSTYISFTLSPETEKIFIGFESGWNEQAATPLCERLEEVLDYDMEIV